MHQLPSPSNHNRKSRIRLGFDSWKKTSIQQWKIFWEYNFRWKSKPVELFDWSVIEKHFWIVLRIGPQVLNTKYSYLGPFKYYISIFLVILRPSSHLVGKDWWTPDPLPSPPLILSWFSNGPFPWNFYMGFYTDALPPKKNNRVLDPPPIRTTSIDDLRKIYRVIWARWKYSVLFMILT